MCWVSWGWLSQLCPLNSWCTPNLFTGAVGWEAEKALDLSEPCSAVRKTSLYCQHCLQHKSKTAPYQYCEKKINPKPPESLSSTPIHSSYLMKYSCDTLCPHMKVHFFLAPNVSTPQAKSWITDNENITYPALQQYYRKSDNRRNSEKLGSCTSHLIQITTGSFWGSAELLFSNFNPYLGKIERHYSPKHKRQQHSKQSQHKTVFSYSNAFSEFIKTCTGSSKYENIQVETLLKTCMMDGYSTN